MYKIELSRKAARFYQKTDTVTARRLNLAFAKLSQDPFKHYNIKRLRGELEGSYRLRVGDIRLVYSVNDNENIVYIEVIRFRGDVYRR
ncbi:MAG: type II toxin-antitoxin system RelE/ParE family toxin [Deltaproteobacteria bacterium]|nr:type II toxin-antitoxin system RelE/ParE family toxin [Deltaproteobacteria bacterium]